MNLRNLWNISEGLILLHTFLLSFFFNKNFFSLEVLLLLCFDAAHNLTIRPNKQEIKASGGKLCFFFLTNMGWILTDVVWKANEMEAKRENNKWKVHLSSNTTKHTHFCNWGEKKLNTEKEENLGWEKREWAAESYKSPIKLSGLIALQLNVHFLCLYWQGCQLHSSSLFTLYVGGCTARRKSQPLFGESECYCESLTLTCPSAKFLKPTKLISGQN